MTPEITEAEWAIILRHRESQAENAAKEAADAEREAKRDPIAEPRCGDSVVIDGRRQVIVARTNTTVELATKEGVFGGPGVMTHRVWRFFARAEGADVRKRGAS